MFTKDNDNEMKKERKFVFKGDPSDYNWDTKPVYGNIYPGTHKGHLEKNGWKSMPIQEWDSEERCDFQEVFEPEQTETLLKDTDLGWFAGLAMQGLCGLDRYAEIDIAAESVAIAKLIIKRLNQETK